MICSKCSNWIPDDARRCPSCGEIFKKKVKLTEEPEFVDPPKKKNKKAQEKTDVTPLTTTLNEYKKKKEEEEEKQTPPPKKQETPQYTPPKTTTTQSTYSSTVSSSAGSSSTAANNSTIRAYTRSLKSAKIYKFFIIICIAMEIINVLYSGYFDGVLNLRFWVNMAAWILPIYAMKRMKPSFMFTAFAMRMLCGMIGRESGVYSALFPILGAILLFCSVKIPDSPFMKLRNLWAGILIYVVAREMISWIPNYINYWGGAGMILTILTFVEIVAISTQISWSANYSK